MISRWCASTEIETARYCPDVTKDEWIDFAVDGHWMCIAERFGNSPGHGKDCQTPRCRETYDCTCECHTKPWCNP